MFWCKILPSTCPRLSVHWLVVNWVVTENIAFEQILDKVWQGILGSFWADFAFLHICPETSMWRPAHPCLKEQVGLLWSYLVGIFYCIWFAKWFQPKESTIQNLRILIIGQSSKLLHTIYVTTQKIHDKSRNPRRRQMKEFFWDQTFFVWGVWLYALSKRFTHFDLMALRLL